MKRILDNAVRELAELIPRLAALEPQMTQLGEAMMKTWSNRGKVMTCGNGGSASDAMHLAEELIARFQKNRRSLAAIALCDPTAVTCAANDFGYDAIFSRQVEGLGNPGDVLIVFSTSGDSPNVIRALETAKKQQLITAGFLGRDGGKARPLCDIPLVVPAKTSNRIQEGHKVLYHALCEWVEQRVD
jgi:D-sedoheptulose 7-phosphate isomerase